MLFRSSRKRFVLSLTGVAVTGALAFSGTAAAQTGGAAPPSDPAAPAAPTTPGLNSGIPYKAKLLSDGSAIPPPNAPTQVLNAIAAGNAIRTRPYIYGGGHASFFSAGYDCSGAVSYVLHGAGLLASPLPSGPLMRWGAPLRGGWITVFSKGSHAYMVVAGLRFDTSAVGERLNQGSGPRWRATKRRPLGYVARHYPGL
ncbi:MAG: hypothetical protein ABR536_02000 [Solirubrobacterales bacterium]